MKRKILFLIESLSGGGAEKVLSTLLQHLDYSKLEVTICCITDIGKYVEEVKPYVNYTSILPNPSDLKGWKKFFYKLQYKSIYNWLPLKWVYQWFIPHHADIEIAFVEGFATKLLAHSTNKKAKKIAWIHIDLEQFHWTQSIFQDIKEEENVYQKYNQLITVSETAKIGFQRKFKNVSTPIKTLYNPIHCQEIIDKSKLIIPLPPKKKESVRLVSIGRFTKQKAYIRLLNIINQLNTLKYPIELWLLGDGEQRNQIEAYIKENHLENIVTLWGFQNNPYPYLAQCDLFVCSSISEGYSTAVTEALILGIPVITTDCSGMDELLKCGECGIITENSDEALYKGLKELLDNPSQLKYYKEKAIKRGKDFSLEKLMKPIEKLLKKKKKNFYLLTMVFMVVELKEFFKQF